MPYQTNVAAAEAQLALSRATLESKRRLVSAQRSNAEIAIEQTRKAQTNLELSMRTEERLKPLTAKGYVPKQQLDQAEVARQNATSSLTEAKEQETAAHHLVDDVAAAEAAVRPPQRRSLMRAGLGRYARPLKCPIFCTGWIVSVAH